MFPSDEVNASNMSTDQVDSATLTSSAANRIAATVATTAVASAARDTKDFGRVRVGAGMMRFDTRDTGRVRVGAGMMRF